MCLIIEKPAGRAIPDHYLVNSASKNGDGCGMAVYFPGQKVRMIKSVSGVLTLARRANTEFKDALVYIHMRMTTHGANSFENTHPVIIPDAPCALMHNGVLYGYGESAYASTTTLDPKDDVSDTREFAETVLSPMLKAAPAAWDNPGFHQLLAEAISRDKMVLLGAYAAYVINRSQGFEEAGIWYSNDYSLKSYKPQRHYPQQSNGAKVVEKFPSKGTNYGNGGGYLYSKSKRMRKREMKECSYKDVCGCSGLCYLENREECEDLGLVASGTGIVRDPALESDMQKLNARYPSEESAEVLAARADVEAALTGGSGHDYAEATVVMGSDGRGRILTAAELAEEERWQYAGMGCD